MKTDRRLIVQVEQAEVAAREKADTARAEIINRKLEHHIEGDKVGPYMATGKPAENTGNETETKTMGRKRRRFLNEASDATPPPAAEPSDSGDNWAEKDRRGYFAGRPGPGRGHFAVGSGAWGTGREGDGDSDLDLLSELTAAIERRGPRWFDELLRASPVVAAQLLSALRKTEPQPGTPGGQQVRIIMGDGLAGIAESIMTRPALGDAADLDLATARREVQRLQGENDSLKRAANDTAPPIVKTLESPKAPEPDGPPVECPQCRRVGYPGRMIDFNQKCRWGCGQWYQDAAAGRETPPQLSPEEVERQAASGIAMCVRLDGEDGWKPVRSLSVPSIRQALADAEARDRQGI